jgi:subtilisin family serine protease
MKTKNRQQTVAREVTVKPKQYRFLLLWLSVCVLLLSLSSGISLAAPPAQEPTPTPEEEEAIPLPPPPEIQALSSETLAKIEPLVVEELTSADQTDFFIWMSEKADLSPAYNLKTKEEKGRFVFETLRQTAQGSQADLRQHLEDQGVDHRPFYIANKILVQGGNAATLVNVAVRPDVARITANHVFQLEEPTVNRESPVHILAIEPNLSMLNADDVWALGHDGSGSVLAGNDTGLDWDHPVLINQYRGWDGITADHNHHWWDATGIYPTVPGDGHGHGTHTTGTMVGADGGANQIGIAPGARTIHCKNMTDLGSGSEATFTECFEWDLAPWDLNGANPRPDLAPDAINNSWGYWGGDNPAFEDEIAALQAAGILVEVSAGNDGESGCASLGSPGDYRQVLTTGSVNHASGSLPGTLTDFSSRGPSDIYPADYIPDVMAPGEHIRSSLPGNGYASWSGTSMAGPHVTGLIGLMWSANPALRGQVETTVQIVKGTAVPLTGQTGSNCGGDYIQGPNNDWGHGSIDALAAVQQASRYGGTGTLTGVVRDAASLSPISDAAIQATLNPTLAWRTATDPEGIYTTYVVSGTYTVDAAHYGHLPAQVTNVSVVSGTTTTLDIELTPASSYVVSGYVTDSTTGWPLYARVTIEGYPGGPVWSDPVTGYYSVTLAEGVTYTFDVEAWVPGYKSASRTIGPLTGDQTEDFGLTVDPVACIAPGYTPSAVYFEDYEDGFGNWTMNGLWNPENEGDVCGSQAAPFPTVGNAPYYGLDGVCSYDNGSANSGTLTMVAPVPLPASGNVALSFWSYEHTECGGNCSWDNRFFEISTDVGGTWATLGEGDTEGDWYQKTIDLTSYLGSDVLIRFRFDTVDDIENKYFGWMVDDVSISTDCVPTSGGLVVGNVYDANTGLPLEGASVGSDSGQSTTTDVNGFYQLFETPSTHTLTASLGGGYGPDIQPVTVIQDDTIQQDFNLPAGHVSSAPDALEATLEMGTSTSTSLVLTNSGSLAAMFELRERDRGFLPLGPIQGSGEWLYRSETGVPMQSNQGDTALAYPSSYRWQPEGRLASLNILIYADDVIHTPPNTFLDMALQSLGLAYTAHYNGDWTGFETDLSGGAWDVVLVGNDNWVPPASTLAALNTYVTGGGRLVFHSWTVAFDPGNALWTTLGFTWASDDNAPPDPVYWWEPGHPVFNDPESVPEFTSLNGGFYMVYGQHVEPLAGFQALAGFTTPGPDPNQAALVLGNDGRTVFKSFLDAHNSADLDGDTRMDGVELWINLIEGIQAGFSGEAPWLFEDPISGTVGSDGGTQSVEITFDASVPEITQPGQYYAELRVEDDTPYDLPSVPITMTINSPTTWGNLTGTVRGLGYCDANPTPLKNVALLIEASTGTTWTLETDANGVYQLWLDEAHSPLSVAATRPDHQVGQVANVTITAQMTTIQDLDLRWLQPCVSAAPSALSATVTLGRVANQSLTLSNMGASASGFSLIEAEGGFAPTQPPSAGQRHTDGQVRVVSEDKESAPKLADSPAFPLASGGPDPFGYTYRDSMELDGPPYRWIEIAPPAGGTGTEISSLTGMDDGYFWPLALPFAFDFYGTDYTELAVATNGTLYFEDAYLGYGNTSIPGSSGYAVERFIAHLWDDLVVHPGAVYYQSLGSMFIIEYYQVSGCCLSPDSATWQVILFQNGNILFQYRDVTWGDPRDNGGSATIGIQGDTTTGLQYSYNTPALSDGLAICFAYPGQSPDCSLDVPWLSEDPSSGSLIGASAQMIDVAFDTSVPEVAQSGEYYATLTVQTDDPVTPWLQIPVTLIVTRYGVELTPPVGAKSGDPNTTITYTLQITNIGLVSDTFDIAVAGNNWTTTTPAQLGPLAAGASVDVDVAVAIPASAAAGATDTATIIVTSQGDNSQSAMATLTTKTPAYRLFLPLIVK